MRRVALVLALAVFGAACGGGGGSDSELAVESDPTATTQAGDTSSASDAATDPRLDEPGFSESAVDAAVLLVEQFGPEGGFDALVLALDAGYSHDQIVEAVAVGRLNADGTITTEEGATAEPDGEPLGLFEAAAAGSDGEQGDDEESMDAGQVVLISASGGNDGEPEYRTGGDFSLEGMRQKAVERSEELLAELEGQTDQTIMTVLEAERAKNTLVPLGIIITFLQRGFTAEQVIDLFLFGGSTRIYECQPNPDPDAADQTCHAPYWCRMTFVYPDGEIVTNPRCSMKPWLEGPNDAVAGDDSAEEEADIEEETAAEPTEEAQEWPLRFRGKGTAISEITYVEAGEIRSCSLQTDMELTFYEDSSVEWFIALFPKVDNDVCGETPGQVQKGTWERDVDDVISFQIDPLNEQSTGEITGSVRNGEAKGMGGFTAETVRVRDKKVVTIFHGEYEFRLPAVD